VARSGRPSLLRSADRGNDLFGECIRDRPDLGELLDVRVLEAPQGAEAVHDRVDTLGENGQARFKPTFECDDAEVTQVDG
jgi:hypothetical protein